jgi:hypothetical protein
MYHSSQGALPPSLAEFKSELARLFPVVLDTKHIAVLDGSSHNTAGI